MARRYTEDPFVPHRRRTREVRVGDVGIGGSNPIRIQSMTTTDTRNTQATADQTELLASVGCEIVRITAPSLTDADTIYFVPPDEVADRLAAAGFEVSVRHLDRRRTHPQFLVVARRPPASSDA